MDQILKIKCWKCSDVFTMRAEVADAPSPNRVDVMLPCPYCETDNQVTVRQDQVKVTELYRKSGSEGASDRMPAELLPDEEYPGAPPRSD